MNTKDIGVLAKSHDLEVIVSGISPTAAYATDLGKDTSDGDDEEEMLDICFDKVSKEGDLSPRQPRSGSNKIKNKAHGRQHSWDGKVTEDFVPRHLPMRLAKQNHMTMSTTLTRSNKSKKN
uniref:NB-ARC domain containing protein n=1 Tax=Solanum tuberosum TaxID=4113 RepID=M1DM58_SOLTU